MESKAGLKIKENFKAQQLRRFISVGSGINRNMPPNEIISKQAETVPSTPIDPSPEASSKEESEKKLEIAEES